MKLRPNVFHIKAENGETKVCGGIFSATNISTSHKSIENKQVASLPDKIYE